METRVAVIGIIVENSTAVSRINEILSEYDDLFYAYEEDLNKLNYTYVQNHADAFS